MFEVLPIWQIIPMKYVRTALQKLSQNTYPNAVESQSPGLAALFAAYPGIAWIAKQPF